MAQNTIPALDDYLAACSPPEKMVFTHLVGDRDAKEVFADLYPLMKQLTITTGFTIDKLGDLMAGFRMARQTEDDQRVERIRAEAIGAAVPVQPVIPQLIGWVFKFPRNEGKRLVRDIRVEVMNMELTSTGTTFPETLLKHSDGSALKLRPKVLFQLSKVSTSEFALSYSKAFPHTRPVMIDAPELTMEELEGYFPWADLAMLQRGTLADFADYIFADGASMYNDLFFSGANLDYRTMHNPSMRVEQLNLKDSASGAPVGADSRTPFTLKAEPYIAANTPMRDFVQNPDEMPAFNVEDADALVAHLEATPDSPAILKRLADAGGVDAPPISAHFFPCPTIWQYSNRIALEAARIVGTTNQKAVSDYRAALQRRYSGQDQVSGDEPSPVSVSTVSLADRPRTVPLAAVNPTPTSPGCLGMLTMAILLIICLFA